MGDKESSSFSVPWGTLLAAVAAVAGVLYLAPSLKSLRPTVAAEDSADDTAAGRAQARLWQDPIEAVQAFQKSARRPSPSHEDTFQIVGTRKVPFHASSPLIEQVAEEPLPNLLGEGLLAEIQQSAKHRGRILAIPVFIPGGSYADDRETRIRSRAAVLSSLSLAGWVPVEGDRIRFVSGRWPSDAVLQRLSGGAAPSTLLEEKEGHPQLMPYEWCRRVAALSNFKDPRTDNDVLENVLILWLREDELGSSPLSKLAVFCDQLQQASRNLEIAIIGPRSSTTLQQIINDAQPSQVSQACPLAWHVLSGVKLISPASTTDAAALEFAIRRPPPAPKENGSTQPVIKPASQPEQVDLDDPQLLKRFTCIGLDFQRTIGTDRVLADALVLELGRRGVDLANDPVAIISEWDTLYGRALAVSFGSAARKMKVSEFLANPTAQSPTPWPKNFYRRNYLRGLDGQLPGDDQSSREKTPDKSSQDDPLLNKLLARGDSELPEGRNQVDYLRRLALNLSTIDAACRRDDPAGRGLRAIGILGSDVYDKLLILQALRTLFPETLFFTTDLESRLVRPTLWETNHNLIIASHFGLHPEWPSPDGSRLIGPLDERVAVAPFRDGYQTSMCFAVMSALRSVTPKVFAEATPKIYEVGRSGPVDITPTLEGGWPRRIPEQWWNGRRTGLVVGIAIACAIGLMLSIHLRKKFCPSDLFLQTLPFSLLSVGFIAIALVILKQSLPPDDEPVRFFQGVSVWPSEALRLLSALMAIHFAFKGYFQLKESNEKLGKDFNLAGGTRLTPAPRPHVNPLWVPIRDWWNNYFTLFTEPERKPELCAPPLKAKDLWAEYVHRSAKSRRMLRVIPTAVLYIIAGGFLFWLFGWPQPPYRGNYSKIADLIATPLSVISMIVLTFMVVDATRLCFRFTDLLCRRTQWPAATLRKFGRERKISRRDMDEYLDIEFLARQTETIGHLVYYPFTVLALLLFARNTFFDNWDWPVALIIVTTVNMAFMIICGGVLRRAAEKARSEDLKPLRKRWLKLLDNDRPRARKLAERLKLTIEQIEGERRGAFSTWSQNPVIRGLLLPSGGLGAWALFKFFTGIE